MAGVNSWRTEFPLPRTEGVVRTHCDVITRFLGTLYVSSFVPPDLAQVDESGAGHAYSVNEYEQYGEIPRMAASQ